MLNGCLKSNRSTRLLAVSLFVILLHAAATYLWAEPVESDIKNPPTARSQAEKSVIHVYFADKNNSYLLSEERVITSADNPIELSKRIIEALLQGPRTNLMQTIPAGTQLRAMFLTVNGTAYVDLTETVTEKHPGGCRSEIMSVYSIVNSLILNVPQIEAVKILIGGREAFTLAGHIDIRYPFKADMLLIR
jgi:spore germination protein GerM